MFEPMFHFCSQIQEPQTISPLQISLSHGRNFSKVIIVVLPDQELLPDQRNHLDLSWILRTNFKLLPTSSLQVPTSTQSNGEKSLHYKAHLLSSPHKSPTLRRINFLMEFINSAFYSTQNLRSLFQASSPLSTQTICWPARRVALMQSLPHPPSYFPCARQWQSQQKFACSVWVIFVGWSLNSSLAFRLLQYSGIRTLLRPLFHNFLIAPQNSRPCFRTTWEIQPSPKFPPSYNFII